MYDEKKHVWEYTVDCCIVFICCFTLLVVSCLVYLLVSLLTWWIYFQLVMLCLSRLVEDVFNSFVPYLLMNRVPTKFGHPETFPTSPEGMAKMKELRETWVAEDLPKFLTLISKMLDDNGNTYLVGGSEPTIADCLAVPLIRGWTRGHLDHVPTTCLDAYPNVVEYIKRFCGHEKIKGRYTDGLNEST